MDLSSFHYPIPAGDYLVNAVYAYEPAGVKLDSGFQELRVASDPAVAVEAWRDNPVLDGLALLIEADTEDGPAWSAPAQRQPARGRRVLESHRRRRATRHCARPRHLQLPSDRDAVRSSRNGCCGRRTVSCGRAATISAFPPIATARPQSRKTAAWCGRPFEHPKTSCASSSSRRTACWNAIASNTA